MPATSFSNLITFSRGTNATVTDSTGRLTYAPHNLLTFSEQFDNAVWSKTNNTVSANTIVAPNGTTTADTIVENTSAGTHEVRQDVTTSATTHMFSTYIKAANRTFAMLYHGQTNSAYVVNLSTGVAAGNAGLNAPISGSVDSVGNGWYRVSMIVATTAASNNFRVYPLSDATTYNYTGNGTASIYVWGAELEAVTYQTTPSTYYPTTVKNLLGFSQDFSNAGWSKTRTVIAGCPFVNPVDGLFTANKLMVDATATATHSVSQDFSLGASVPVTASIYVKAAEYTTGRLVLTALSGSFPEIVAIFDLTAATVTTSSSGGTTVLGSSITPLSNGWYRVSISGFTGLSGNHRFWVYPNTNSTFTGDGNSGIYIYGAQLSDSASLDPYVPTPAAAPSSTAYYGPRFDYDPVTLAPKGLLVEEARTNLPLYSEQFDNAYWNKANSSVTANAAVSPDGSNNADKLVENTATSTHTIGVTLIAGSAVYTYSVYVKAAGRSVIRFRDSVNGVDGFFDLGTATSPSGTAVNRTITSVGNGWYRCTMTSSAAVTNPEFGVRLATAVGTENYTGDGTSGVFIYGAQIEAGSFATSYIPTVASTVTRSADVATITGSLFSQWYRQDQGTFVVRMNTAASPGSFFSADNGTSDNRVFSYGIAGGAAFGGITANAVAGYLQSLGTITANVPFATATAYNTNDANTSFNGTAGTTDTSVAIPVVDRLRLGVNVSTVYLNGHIQNITYIPNRISNDQLQAATS